ncbi:hypothetical protein MPTK1_8g11210 [Marchantia polymorpha subsp. ruderalis]|uniref:Uncharacterized protein n=1 Tax=Marchantia polymorpha TaxID=3197 RepID=A0A2R6XMI8_MARPO|nr:hypothetical protein MARPO_0008s0100 [Marchantia polymorpha]BBN19500.1 hypothetical protein Mp_8g11210 [Marchantia polymorpha subsp. ruderalis]|eukprot:PTQ47329.1 hypothetical protein MARPO_0008s0100 [Marchantia polymorpha]
MNPRFSENCESQPMEKPFFTTGDSDAGKLFFSSQPGYVVIARTSRLFTRFVELDASFGSTLFGTSASLKLSQNQVSGKRNMGAARRKEAAGSVVLVTGCKDGGIGSLLAMVFAAAVCHVLATPCSLSSVIRSKMSPGIQTMELDITTLDSVLVYLSAQFDSLSCIDPVRWPEVGSWSCAR